MTASFSGKYEAVPNDQQRGRSMNRIEWYFPETDEAATFLAEKGLFLTAAGPAS